MAAALLPAACSSGGNAKNTDDVLLPELSAPRGLALASDGRLLVSEVGRGRVLAVSADGDVEVIFAGLPASLDSGPGSNYPAGVTSVIETDGDYAILVSEYRSDRFNRLYVSADGAAPEPITAPVSINLPAENRFSNPYDFIEAPELGGWLVADSGRNAIVAVTADGSTRDYALFSRQEVPGREHPVDVVPTGIARGPDGAVYIGSLTGYPYPQGAAAVWRIEDRNGDGDALDNGEVEVAYTGFTTITDIAFDDQGRLYVSEFTSDMLSVIEDGGVSEQAADYPGRVVRVDGTETEVVADGLTSPTSILVDGDVLYVSEEFAGTVRRVNLAEGG